MTKNYNIKIDFDLNINNKHWQFFPFSQTTYVWKYTSWKYICVRAIYMTKFFIYRKEKKTIHIAMFRLEWLEMHFLWVL